MIINRRAYLSDGLKLLNEINNLGKQLFAELVCLYSERHNPPSQYDVSQYWLLISPFNEKRTFLSLFSVRVYSFTISHIVLSD